MKISSEGAPKHEGWSRTQFVRPAPGNPVDFLALALRGLDPQARLTVFIRQQCSIIAQMSKLNTPLVQGNWVLQMCLNPIMMPIATDEFRTPFKN
jgi:hypothetical protein